MITLEQAKKTILEKHGYALEISEVFDMGDRWAFTRVFPGTSIPPTDTLIECVLKETGEIAHISPIEDDGLFEAYQKSKRIE